MENATIQETKLPQNRPDLVPQRPAKRKYMVLLPEDLGEWGKQRPDGLSHFMRRLLEEERAADTPAPERILPTAEDFAAEEAEFQACWNSLPPERQEQKRAALARSIADSEAGRVKPGKEVYAGVRSYLHAIANGTVNNAVSNGGRV